MKTNHNNHINFERSKDEAKAESADKQVADLLRKSIGIKRWFWFFFGFGIALILSFMIIVNTFANFGEKTLTTVTISGDWFEELVKVYFGNYSQSNNYIVQKTIEWDSQDTINLLVIRSSETDSSLILNKNGTWRIEK